MKNIVYVSSAVRLLGEDQLMDILTSARKNNAEYNISGILFYAEGTFMQVLEGEDADVDYIMGKIILDPRHKNLITLLDEPIQKKNFTDWTMGFTTPNADKFGDILGYLRSVKELQKRPETTPAVITIKTFIESNRLTVAY
jgi:hypothetical protein